MTTPDELRALADRIERKPQVVWRMQKPDGAYCMEWDRRTTMHPEMEATEYYAEHAAKYPENAAQYKIARVEVLSEHDEDCNRAAALIRAMAAAAPPPPIIAIEHTGEPKP